ncbi:MAG: DNA repair protein RecN [Pyrinomonadaceae bacterium]|nr:DNA repair protein RecN [Pyrinomonadaceae bacterium]
MLTLFKIKNIALIDRLELEFGSGLNLLTGETGSGKSIIVDSLGALTGDRVSSDLIKQGESAAQIEGSFKVEPNATLIAIFEEAGVDLDPDSEIIVRRDISLAGKNRIFVNDQSVTQNFLKRLGEYLVEIHGQGEQAALYRVETHIGMLDEFADVKESARSVEAAFFELAAVKAELANLEKDESEKLQLLDILRYQVDEIKRAGLRPGEDAELEEEKRRVGNAEKLSNLSDEAYALLYDNDQSTVSTLEKAARKIAELGEYDASFREFDDGLRSAQAVIEELAIAARDFRRGLDFSPERLNEIEDRLAEISRLKRKYGESTEAILSHLAESERRLANIETAELREKELKKELADKRLAYVAAAEKLHQKRIEAARAFETAVEANLKGVALERAKFEVRIDSPDPDVPESDGRFTSKGFDTVEFYFSANPGEPAKPLSKVASGGEASRLMLILKTTLRSGGIEKAAVFDEIDVGIGGRVAEAVGRKLKELSGAQQVLCVTHQPQIASLADRHFVVEKDIAGSSTSVTVRELDAGERLEEIARMLAGEQITDAARENARAMLGKAN